MSSQWISDDPKHGISCKVAGGTGNTMCFLVLEVAQGYGAASKSKQPEVGRDLVTLSTEFCFSAEWYSHLSNFNLNSLNNYWEHLLAILWCLGSKMQVWSLGLEDPLSKEMATPSSILEWEVPRTKESGGLQSMGSQRVRHDLVTKTANSNNKPTSCRIFTFKKSVSRSVMSNPL